MMSPVPPMSYTGMYSNNQLMDISGLLAEYAPDALAVVGDEINAYRYGDGIYGIPTHRDLATNTYIGMRKDILDDLGLLEQAKAMESWADYETICAVVKEKSTVYPMLYGLEGSFAAGSFYGEKFSDTVVYDTFGSDYLYVDSDNNISNFFEQERAVENLKMYASWAEKGYFWPDSALTADNQDTNMKQGVGFSGVLNSELTVETAKGKEWGTPVVAVEVCPTVITTKSLISWGMVIPVTAEEPEAACKFINLLYTSPELNNLHVYGVEGVDYDLLDTGEAKTRDNADAYFSADFLIGNQFLVYPASGAGGDARKLAQAATEAAPKSPYLGFSADTSMLDNQSAALSAVMDQYSRNLRCGGYTEALYAEFLDKLKAANIDSYIAEFQKQLDAWLAGN